MRRRASGIVACAAIAGIGGSILGLKVSTLAQFDNKALSRAVVTQTQGTYRQELCLFHAIRKAVPEGAGIYLNGNDETHLQRLAELSTLWATPEEHQRAAQWIVTITRPAAFHLERALLGERHFRCYGDMLVVRPA